MSRAGVCTAALGLALLVPGCVVWDAGGTVRVRVLVTEDFGAVVHTNERLRLPGGATALDAVREVGSVETSFGGAFITAIDGRASGFPASKRDWFVEINGVHSPVGGAEVVLHDGDWVLWDLREWDRAIALPGLVVAWPRPLSVGWDGVVGTTAVVADAGLEDLAADVRAGLGAEGVEVVRAGAHATHRVLLTLRPLEDVMAPEDPVRRFVETSPDGSFRIVDGPTLTAPHAVALRMSPPAGSPPGTAWFVVSATHEAAFDRLIDAARDWTPSGLGLAVNRTVVSAVPP